MSDFNPQKDTGNVERYTPPHIVEAAREVMGSITFDPASCELANTVIVRAKHFIGLPNDGLVASWHGNVWVNWPYGRKANKEWATKVVDEYYENHAVTAVCAITWLSGSSEWFQQMMAWSTAYCILSKRPKFIDAATMQPMGSAMKDGIVWYFGNQGHLFVNMFGKYGVCGSSL